MNIMAYINKPTKAKKYKPRTSINANERKKIYNSKAWKNLRHSKLIRNPICEVCLMQHRINDEPIDVHHLISFMSTTDEVKRCQLAYDYSNLISVCRNCHSLLHTGYLKGCNTKEAIYNKLKQLNLIPEEDDL